MYLLHNNIELIVTPFNCLGIKHTKLRNTKYKFFTHILNYNSILLGLILASLYLRSTFAMLSLVILGV